MRSRKFEWMVHNKQEATKKCFLGFAGEQHIFRKQALAAANVATFTDKAYSKMSSNHTAQITR